MRGGATRRRRRRGGAVGLQLRARRTRSQSASHSSNRRDNFDDSTNPLEAVNGKPVPYTFEANKCIMLDAKIELKADGAYSTASNMDCAGAKYAFPTSGLFGIVGGTATFAVGVGPVPAPGSVVTKIDGATLTIVAGADTYTYKKH